MRHTIFRKTCIVLALVAMTPLVLASVSGSTLAYLKDSETLSNTFIFEEQPPLGNNRTDRVSYYYLNKSGVETQIQDTGYTGNTWTYRANERIFVNTSNTNIKAAPNGFRLSYITYGNNNTRVNAGSSFLQPTANNTQINVYFEPIVYTITYDFNGYDESDITFSETPLQSTYTVFDMIKIPYEAATVVPYGPIERFVRCTLGGLFGGGDSIQCRDDVPTMEIDGNTLLGWDDQNDTLHTYGNADGSWENDMGNVANNRVYTSFAARQSGDLVLTARWEIEVSRNNVNGRRAMSMEMNDDDASTDNDIEVGEDIEVDAEDDDDEIDGTEEIVEDETGGLEEDQDEDAAE